MRSLILSIVAAALAVCASTAIAMDVTELKLESSNKVVIKVRFDNGSVADPADRQGLTYITASMMAEGGAGGVPYADIQDRLYPWAAAYYVVVDKQATTFTFQVRVCR
jgi:zinc protease